ncbi:hypothetical protein Trydic_g15224 [Trypoxylus dichotomus]
MFRRLVFVYLTLKYSSCVVLNYNKSYILEYVTSRNYPLEVHATQTSDGYLLSTHRIPRGSNNKSGSGVVLLVHGLQESAEHWMINGDKSLAFLLADLGYDVWMSNARGSYHSMEHVAYDTSEPEYWDFSWHEIGLYDISATIDYILLRTKSAKLAYIGHSQGVTSFLVLTSTYPEYNDKISIMVGLAPAAYMAHVRNPLFRTMSRFWELIYAKKGMLNNALINVVTENICKDKIVIQNICSNMLFLMAGYDYEQLDKSLIPDIMRTLPAGSSTKQWVHYLQLVRSGYFRQYDYLPLENLRRYGEANPPTYNLSKVTSKVALYYSKNDWLAMPEDVRRLRDELPNVVVDHVIIYEGFNHWDFLFAKDIVPLLYSHLADTLRKYNE